MHQVIWFERTDVPRRKETYTKEATKVNTIFVEDVGVYYMTCVEQTCLT